VQRPDGPDGEHGLPQGDGEVVILALVVHGVDRPEQVHPVREPMPPVVDEVDRHEGDHPRPRGALAEREQAVLVQPDVTARDHGDFEDEQDLLRHAAREVGDDVREPVELEPAALCRPQLDADEQEEERDR